MTRQDDDYMLGTSDDELQRLGFQHQVWLDDTVSLWRTAGFGFGHEIVDLGCGPGFATVDLARLVGPEGRVHALEASRTFLGFLESQCRSARLGNVSAVECDVHALGLPDAGADGVFARWVLCFVGDPAKVIAECARVLRPGGTLVVMDYFNYHAAGILPDDPAFVSLFRGFYASAVRHGGSYDIGNRLPGLVLDAGLEIQSLCSLSHVARPGSLHWEWLAMFVRGYVPMLVELGIWTELERRAFEEAWSRASNDRAAFFFTPPVLGLVARKSG